jgi:hypothetical protein
MSDFSNDLMRRRRLLLTFLTLLACRYPSREPPVVIGARLLLGGWPGIGRIAVGMARQGFDLQLTRYGNQGWRATFYPAGIAHSVTAAVSSAWEPEPWTAVQRAAWEGLMRREMEVP